jgi:hypothetical protein
LEVLREKNQIIYKGKSMEVIADFSTETLQARRAWSEVFGVLKENNFSPRILHQTKLSFKIEGRIKTFHEKQKQTVHDK